MGILTYSDIDLVTAIRGNPSQRKAAINWIVNNTHLKNKIFSFVLANGGTRQDAQEVFHDVVLNLLKSVLKGRYNPEYSIEQYLMGITRHLWYRTYKQKVKRFTVELKDDYYFPVEMEIEILLSRKDQLQALKDLMHLVGSPCNEVLRMWAHGYSTKEIAQHFEQDADYTRVQIFRCKRKMEELLEKHPGLRKRFKE